MSTGSMTGDMKGRNWPRLGLIVVGVVAVVALGVYGYRTLGAGKQADKTALPQVASAVLVKTASVSQGPIGSSLSYSGDVKAASSVSVLPKGSGRIESLPVDVGSRVSKGDSLAVLDSASLRASLSQAEANLAAAQAKYDSLAAGPRAEAVSQAGIALDSAQARADLLRKGARAEQLDAARASLDSARANLDSARANVALAQTRLDTVKRGPTQTQWGSALAAVDAARANMRAAAERLTEVKAGPKAAEVAAAVASVQAAETNLLAREDGLEQARNGTPLATWAAVGTSVSQAYAAVASAQASYNSASAALDLLKSRPLPADLAAAQSALDALKASNDAANAAVDELKQGPKKEDLGAASAGVDAATGQAAAATGQAAAAEANLRLLEAGPTEEDVRQADNAVESARQALSLASRPYTASDLAQAQAAVSQASAAADQARIALSEASVTSPVDGVVSDRLQSVGQLVGPTSPIVSIVSAEVEIALGVEESQIGQVVEGQKAEITVAAFPGTVFPAKVAMIAPSADPKSRTFQVKVRPTASDGKLKAGMFAQVRIVTSEKASALLVPKEALVTKAGQTSVFVLKGETVESRQVKTGMVSGSAVEVLSGVAAGEEVVVAGGADLRDGAKVKKS
jgi:RND family efflux transporter MFP subunit